MNGDGHMFVRVVRGHATSRATLETEWQRWASSAVNDGSGYLGATAGVADDDTFIAMIRFESRATADQAMGPASEWSDVLTQLRNPVVRDSDRTDIWNKGGSDDAGFVQIRQGVSNDPERLRDLYVNQQPVRMGPYRPEVVGGLFAWHDDHAFTLSAYFTSQDDARRGEHLHEFESFFDDINAVMQDLTYIDLHKPWLSSAEQQPIRDDDGRSPGGRLRTRGT